ncbi:MAG: hypothetical protein U0470_07920 [Anaerolineae bacterium]
MPTQSRPSLGFTSIERTSSPFANVLQLCRSCSGVFWAAAVGPVPSASTTSANGAQARARRRTVMVGSC